MTDRSKRSDIQLPQLPLRPGRPAFSKRTRLVLAAGLLVVFAAILVGGAILAHSSSKGRVVTIPAADRSATPALVRAAEAVHFRPPSRRRDRDDRGPARRGGDAA